ncbi:hypothetical protein Leryth_009133 [Lithospermum erythrorhizon]|nr:hypothetical protein Leryth_009133 [Lithospermum erythrorhizon]
MEGVATQVATQAQGIPFGFTNSLDIDKRTGIIYFTDSSTRYQRRNHISVIVSGDNSGRLMKFDPESKQVTILLNDLKFPNGVALSENGDFLLVAETTTCKILKVWLQDSKAGNVEVIEELPGFPDNIKRNHNGEFWVGINSKRGKLLKWAISNSWLQKNVLKLPFDSTKAHSYLADFAGNGMGIRLNKNGNVVEIIEGGWKHVSEVEEKYGSLWVGSVKRPFAIKMHIS